MSAFVYKAIDPGGRVVRGELLATSEAELDSRLLQIGLQLINCKAVKKTGRKPAGVTVNRRELINFCFHLGQAHKAGVSVIDALGDLRDSTEHDSFRNVLASLSLAVESGKPLSDAMAGFPATFDKVFVNLIRAGEKSGELSQVLAKMTESLKWQDELVAQTKKLIMYPAFVGTVVIAVVFFLMLYVVPQMSEFLKNMGQEMPLHTKILIATSNVIMNYWYVMLSLPVVAFFTLRYLIAHNLRFRRGFDRLKLRMWVVGAILEKIVMSRFVTYFQIMYASGIPVVDALKASRDLAGNAMVADALEQVSGFVEQGNSLSGSLQKAGLFPPLVVRMVRMGEDTGQLEEALQNVTYFYSREVEEGVDRLQGMIEPAMTVILGLILGWVMMSVLGPIYDTIGKIAV